MFNAIQYENKFLDIFRNQSRHSENRIILIVFDWQLDSERSIFQIIEHFGTKATIHIMLYILYILKSMGWH